MCCRSVVDGDWSVSLYLVEEVETNTSDDIEWTDTKVKAEKVSFDIVWPWDSSDIFLQNMELADNSWSEQLPNWHSFISHTWHSRNDVLCSSFTSHPFMKTKYYFTIKINLYLNLVIKWRNNAVRILLQIKYKKP